MKTVGAFCVYEDTPGAPSGDPEEILSSEGSEDAETSLTEFQPKRALSNSNPNG